MTFTGALRHFGVPFRARRVASSSWTPPFSPAESPLTPLPVAPVCQAARCRPTACVPLAVPSSECFPLIGPSAQPPARQHRPPPSLFARFDVVAPCCFASPPDPTSPTTHGLPLPPPHPPPSFSSTLLLLISSATTPGQGSMVGRAARTNRQSDSTVTFPELRQYRPRSCGACHARQSPRQICSSLARRIATIAPTRNFFPDVTSATALAPLSILPYTVSLPSAAAHKLRAVSRPSTGPRTGWLFLWRPYRHRPLACLTLLRPTRLAFTIPPPLAVRASGPAGGLLRASSPMRTTAMSPKAMPGP